MGFRCSPDWCNLYLLDKEMAAVDRIWAHETDEAVKAAKLGAFRYFFRSMDDLRIINGNPLVHMITNPGPRSATGTDWVYPECLRVSSTVTPKQPGTSFITTCFLDLLTRLHDDGTVTMTTYKKECRLPFLPIKYVTTASNRPRSMCYNVAIGLVISAAYHASSARKAFNHMFDVVAIMRGRGFKRKDLWQRVATALLQRQLPGLKFEQRALWALCIRQAR
jgi:hypothetical protein